MNDETKMLYDAVTAGLRSDGAYTPSAVVAQLIVPKPTDPMAVAREFVRHRYTDRSQMVTVAHHRGDFYAWDGTCWPESEDRTMRSELYRWLEPAVYVVKTPNGEAMVKFEPTKVKIGNVFEALQAIGHLAAKVNPPVWLSGNGPINAHGVVAMANGLLDLPTRTLYPHTPDFFVQHSLPFDYDPDAPAPERWLRFLHELWEDDVESIDALGELFGYILSGDTRYQKLFMLVGPKRAGKGVIGRVLGGLVGAYNTVGPTLASLTGTFGLQSLVGKPLAVVSDARLGNRTDGMIAVERLLSISGEDIISVDRKFKEAWTGQLPTRFVILTNEIPRFTDSSGALASRFVVLVLTRSWYGQEDQSLTDSLLNEAPGIFNWALEGLDRLHARGHFEMPATAAETLRHLEDMSSPVGAFVRDRCDTGIGFDVDVDELFNEWRTWCEAEGRDKPGTKAIFGRDLRAAVPGVRGVRTRDGDERGHVYQGIRLRAPRLVTLTTPDHPDPSPDLVRGAAPRNSRSDGVVRGGQGNSPLRAHVELESGSDDPVSAWNGAMDRFDERGAS